jgi:hypothetical protein
MTHLSYGRVLFLCNLLKGMHMTTVNILHHISTIRFAQENCRLRGSMEWEARHTDRLNQFQDHLCGAGLAVTISDSMSLMNGPDDDPEVLAFDVSVEMMTEHGMMDGRFDFMILVRPGFVSPNITVECDQEDFQERWPDRDLDREQDYVVEMLLERLRQPAPAQPVNN